MRSLTRAHHFRDPRNRCYRTCATHCTEPCALTDGKTIALDSFSPADTKPYLALETDDMDKELARLRKRGVPVVMDVMDNKVCKMAIIKDPNGHALMLHQMEPGRLKALKAPKTGASPKAKAAAKTKARTKSKPTAAARPKATKAAGKKPSAKARRRR